MSFDLVGIQAALREERLDGWLLVDFHSRNDIAIQLLGLTGVHLTRRFACFIPAEGRPMMLVHAIERIKFEHLPVELIPFSAYRVFESELKRLLNGKQRVAMEYSEFGRLPYVALVDAGTLDFVRSLGVEIVSSADLVAGFSSRLTDAQIASHRRAAAALIEIKDGASALMSQRLAQSQTITEWDVVSFIREQFAQRNMITDHGPNCSVAGNAGNPHYEPTAESHQAIDPNQIVLIDLWAKEDHVDGIYGDITWMFFSGSEADIPDSYRSLFGQLVAARNAGVEFLKDNWGQRDLCGWEVDDAVRNVLVDAGVAEMFTHRTGHSINQHTHGSGPNIDNLETADQRRLQPGHLFSIEPGLYSDEFGFRTEIDCLITPEGPEVTTLPLQTAIVSLG